ncbi:MAG: hypothetical protein KGD57_08735 [Candidatus Lokiarchaeota archaeon]|nr:hypothetical protein [Candidatus Lokiarchaeota archaeon]
MSEDKEGLRKLIMLISELRAKDEERYEAHVDFMNQTIKMISAIESQMNKHWKTVLESLTELNENINANLDSLLTGINPKGLRETSISLREIMDTMNKSVQSMNLEKVLSELKLLKGVNVQYAAMTGQEVSIGQQPEQITTSLNPPGLKKPGSTTAKQGDAQWVDPNEAAEKKRKKEEDEPHLLKPSDFFGS